MRLGLAPLLSALVVLLVLLVPACGGDDVGASSLESTLWVLASGPGQGEGGADGTPNATFEGGALQGSTGCNRYSGEYTVDGNALEIGPLAVTQMACASPSADVERAYLAALGAVAEWRVEDEKLVLSGDEGELLRYAPASP